MNPALVLIILGGLLILLARQAQRRAGMPPGMPVYIDHHKLEPAAPLFDPELRLAGRPDYLVKQRNSLIPVEIKSGQSPLQPYDSHLLQLAAYMRLVETQHGRRPGHGFIAYPQRSFRVANTHGLERRLLTTLSEMRGAHASLPSRSHSQPERCRGCGFRSVCDQALGS
jgi:CRISPR-associated exonuclease Cas4